MVDLEALAEQQILCLHHVVVAVVGKVAAQAIARLAGFAVADAIGQYDKKPRRIERLPRPEELAGELVAHEVAAVAAGAMHDEHRIAHHALRIRTRMAKGTVVDAQLRQRFTGREAEILENVVRFDRRRIVRRARHRPNAQQGQQRARPHLQPHTPRPFPVAYAVAASVFMQIPFIDAHVHGERVSLRVPRSRA